MSSEPTDKIAFVGAGNIAQALIRGLVGAKSFLPVQLVASDPSAEQRALCSEPYRIHTSSSNVDAVTGASIVILAIKPLVVARVLEELRDALHPEALLVSVVAGVTTAKLEAQLMPGARVVRTMPNVCAFVGHGATALSAGRHARDEDLAIARQIFDTVGSTVVVDESLIDAVTGLSGSGPAYVFMAIEALADGGVKMGLSRQDAQQLAAQTVKGAATLMLEGGEHPGQLKDRVCSAGGTTIAGVHALEQGGFRAALIGAVEAATRRARELSENKPP